MPPGSHPTRFPGLVGWESIASLREVQPRFVQIKFFDDRSSAPHAKFVRARIFPRGPATIRHVESALLAHPLRNRFPHDFRSRFSANIRREDIPARPARPRWPARLRPRLSLRRNGGASSRRTRFVRWDWRYLFPQCRERSRAPVRTSRDIFVRGFKFADGAIPIEPTTAGPRSERMSPNRFDPTTTSNHFGKPHEMRRENVDVILIGPDVRKFLAAMA